MKFGLFAINMGPCSDPVTAVRVAQAAEAAGFESVWTGDHIVLPDPQVPASPVPQGIGQESRRHLASAPRPEKPASRSGLDAKWLVNDSYGAPAAWTMSRTLAPQYPRSRVTARGNWYPAPSARALVPFVRVSQGSKLSLLPPRAAALARVRAQRSLSKNR